MPGMLDMARAQCKPVDLTILVLVETLREQQDDATPGAVAGMIKGAPVRTVAEKMEWLKNTVQALDRDRRTYRVSPLGAELLAAEIEGWQPSPREQIRRDHQLRSAQVGRSFT